MTEISVDNQSDKKPNKPWQFKPGQSGNPAGKPKGVLSFKTKFFKAIDSIAKAEGKTPSQVELDIIKVGIKKAKEGDYNFYRDGFDRVYGKAQGSVDVTTGGEKLNSSQINPEDQDAIDAFHDSLKKNREKRVKKD